MEGVRGSIPLSSTKPKGLLPCSRGLEAAYYRLTMSNYAEYPIHLAGGLIFDVVVGGDPLDDSALLQARDRINVVVKDGQIYRDEVSIPGRFR